MSSYLEKDISGSHGSVTAVNLSCDMKILLQIQLEALWCLMGLVDDRDATTQGSPRSCVLNHAVETYRY